MEHKHGDSGGLLLGGAVGEDAIAELTSPLKIAGLEGEAESLREQSLVDRDLAPPGAVVVGEVVGLELAARALLARRMAGFVWMA